MSLALNESENWRRVSVPSDVQYLSPRLREADKRELAAVGYTPEQALSIALIHGRETFTMLDPITGEPLGMFGVQPEQPGMAKVWALSSDAVFERWQTRFLRRSREWIIEANARHPLLHNMVHEHNVVHVRWLEWLGCVFIARRYRRGEPFLEFVRIPHV